VAEADGPHRQGGGDKHGVVGAARESGEVEGGVDVGGGEDGGVGQGGQRAVGGR
jgi:hypothetical protein